MSSSSDPKAEMEAARAEVSEVEKEIKAIKMALGMISRDDSASKVNSFKLSALKVGYITFN